MAIVAETERRCRATLATPVGRAARLPELRDDQRLVRAVDDLLDHRAKAVDDEEVSLERSEREPTLIVSKLGSNRSIVRTRPEFQLASSALDSPCRALVRCSCLSRPHIRVKVVDNTIFALRL